MGLWRRRPAAGRFAALVVLVGALEACAPTLDQYARAALERDIRSGVCADGAPIKLLLGAGCRFGICGYTCGPDRWP